MTIDEAIQFFGSGYRLASILNIKYPNIQYWRKKNRITSLQQLRIQKITNGKLKADDEALAILEADQLQAERFLHARD
jgi:hypothetical protein